MVVLGQNASFSGQRTPEKEQIAIIQEIKCKGQNGFGWTDRIYGICTVIDGLLKDIQSTKVHQAQSNQV